MADRDTKMNFVYIETLVPRLTKAISKKRKRILVAGDAMTDYWIDGDIGKCQEECLKFVAKARHVSPGGANNAADCLENWGIETDLYSYPQSDYPEKWRFVHNKETIFRFDNEMKLLSKNGSQYARKLALEMIPFSGAVLLSDYDKGFLTADFLTEVIELCRKKNIPCVVDAKRNPTLYSGALIKCNDHYQHEHRYIGDVCTSGAVPPLVNDFRLELELPAVICVNHVGAGDCFGAHLTLALAYGFSLQDAATLAHSAGRVYVQYPHNRAPHPSEIEADLKS